MLVALNGKYLNMILYYRRMRGKIKDGLELVVENASCLVERVQQGENEDSNLGCAQQIAR